MSAHLDRDGQWVHVGGRANRVHHRPEAGPRPVAFASAPAPDRTRAERARVADALAHHRYCRACGMRVGHWAGCR